MKIIICLMTINSSIYVQCKHQQIILPSSQAHNRAPIQQALCNWLGYFAIIYKWNCAMVARARTHTWIRKHFYRFPHGISNYGDHWESQYLFRWLCCTQHVYWIGHKPIRHGANTAIRHPEMMMTYVRLILKPDPIRLTSKNETEQQQNPNTIRYYLQSFRVQWDPSWYLLKFAMRTIHCLAGARAYPRTFGIDGTSRTAYTAAMYEDANIGGIAESLRSNVLIVVAGQRFTIQMQNIKHQ